MYDELKPEHIGSHLGKQVTFESLHPDLQRRLQNDFDHLNLIYTGKEQLRAMVLFSDGSIEPFTIVTLGRDKKPDCKISSFKLNLYFRTAKGVNSERYNSLGQLQSAVIRKIKSVLEKYVVNVDFHLVDEVNPF
jgi:hypothetical protein